MKKLNKWFEIDEKQYIWYILQGYTIDVNKDRVKWIMDNKRHREDGPAVNWLNGSQYWYVDGKLHREDGPAVIRANGTQEWYVDGKRHREDGPAVIWADGTQEWYLNGKLVTEAEVMKPVKELTVAEVERLLGYSVKIVK